jgi:hypothetical protein
MAMTAAASPQLMARMAGLLYLGTIVTGLLAHFGRSGVIVRGDSAATAANILAPSSPGAFRLRPKWLALLAMWA